jgi:hypothetical protein
LQIIKANSHLRERYQKIRDVNVKPMVQAMASDLLGSQSSITINDIDRLAKAVEQPIRRDLILYMLLGGNFFIDCKTSLIYKGFEGDPQIK